MNDLLYIAAVIAPGSFSDITIGNSTSSFVYGGGYTSDSVYITPTGYGYSAGAGYDLVTGLGTPNGMLLARALTDIAHTQMYFDGVPDVIDSNGTGGWTSGTAQTLLLQTTATASAHGRRPHRRRHRRIASSAAPRDLRLDQPARAAGRCRPTSIPTCVALFDGQTPGRAHASRWSRRATASRSPSTATPTVAAQANAQRRVRLRRLLCRQRQLGAARAVGGGRRDGERRRRRERRGAHAPGRRRRPLADVSIRSTTTTARSAAWRPARRATPHLPPRRPPTACWAAARCSAGPGDGNYAPEPDHSASMPATSSPCSSPTSPTATPSGPSARPTKW